MQTVCDHGTHWIVSEDGAWRPVAKDSAEGQQITGDREALAQVRERARRKAQLQVLEAKVKRRKRKLEKAQEEYARAVALDLDPDAEWRAER